jgi:hypothetical protein
VGISKKRAIKSWFPGDCPRRPNLTIRKMNTAEKKLSPRKYTAE